MLTHLKKAKDRVEVLLDKYPQTRDCDKTLWLAYLVESHGLREQLGEEAYLKFRAILMHPKTCSMESVRRVRQKFQENGKYLGANRKAKLAEEEAVRDYIRS